MLVKDLDQPILPTPYFELGLKKAVSGHPDLIVLTGDLVHEGDARDYLFLREMVERGADGIPVIPVLGNHDNKRAFREGYLGLTGSACTDEPYHAVYEWDGWRFVVIDTAKEGQGDGFVSEDEASWLRSVLAERAQRGTVLLGHHPFESQQGWFTTTLPDGFLEMLQGSDIIAYLCGHAHYNEARPLGHMLQATTESFDYGVETWSDEVVYTEARGYNTCWLEARHGDLPGKAIVHTHQLFPFNPVIHRMPL